jgi:hypothetical protein
MGETSRQARVKGQESGQAHNEVGFLVGQIASIDKQKKAITAIHPESKNKLCRGMQITLGHTVHDIVDRFGTIRVGMEVLIFYQGNKDNPAAARAFIIGEEDELGPNQLLALNNIAQGFHNVLMENL